MKTGRWKKGQSGNPKGRPKRGDSFAEALRAAFTAAARKQIANKAVDLAKQGSINAMALIRDTLDGKPTQAITIDITQRIIEAAEREGVDPQEAIAMAERILKEQR